MRIYTLVFLIISCIFTAFSQEAQKDTLSITLPEAEKLFLDKNLVLLAERCNVEAARAMIIQAKLFTNPTVTVEQGLYDPKTKKWMDVNSTGETAVQLSKVFLLAGKRNKRIHIEQYNTQRYEYMFFDLMRTLKFTLRTDFNSLYFISQNLNVYDREINSLKSTIGFFEAEYQKGYVSFKELMRLKAMLFSLENGRMETRRQVTEIQTELNVMLQLKNKYIKPILDLPRINQIQVDSVKLPSLIDSAIVNRYDVKAAETTVKLNEYNVRYQKALGVPDLTLSAGWDKQGSYVNNYNFLAMQIDLPFFNRNQGNIKAAKYNLENSKYLLDNSRLLVEQDVINAFSKAVESESIYKSFDNHFQDDFNKLIDQIIINYQKKNISLLEFLDFYDAYKENAIQYNSLQSYRINAFEELNYSTGKNIFNY